MLEVQFYGRGGQGLYLASQILAYAAFLDGKFVQSFPEFTAERRGAPISAFLRISSKPIWIRCKIYKQNAVLIFDPSFLDRISEIVENIKPAGFLLVNCKDDLKVDRKIRVAHVNADGFAKQYGLYSTEGQYMGNMAMLGAFCRLTKTIKIKSLVEAIRKKAPKMQEENIKVAMAGYRRLVFQKDGFSTEISSRKPKTRERLDLISISHEITKGPSTRTWRMCDPVFTEKCTGCKLCSFFCPDGAIRFGEDGKGLIDLEHCKGCWVCIDVCPVEGAIEKSVNGGG